MSFLWRGPWDITSLFAKVTLVYCTAMNSLLLTSSLVILSSVTAISTSTPRQIRNKRICRSCGQLGREVSKRMEETAANPRVVKVAARIGADGRPISGRKIDYLNS